MSLCIFATATKSFQHYMLLFSYFCLKAYPDCGVKVLLSDCKLDHKYKALVGTLEKMGDFKVLTITGYPQDSKTEKRMLRWMMDESFFESYENVFITDIDILICREQQSLEKRNLECCQRTGLPYNNVVRPTAKRRLVGNMHFIRTKEYYKVMAGVVDKYRKLLKKGKLGVYNDEELLYKMVEESGLGLSTEPFLVHHSGVHLGIWKGEEGRLQNGRAREGKVLRAIREGVFTQQKEYKGYLSFYQSLRQDPLFKQINKISPSGEVKNMEKWKDKEYKE